MRVHDFIADLKEFLCSKSFRKEVSKVLISLYIWNHELTVLDHLSNIEVSSVDVFGASMVFGIICEVACPLVIAKDFEGRVVGDAKFCGEALNPSLCPILRVNAGSFFSSSAHFWA